MAHHLGLDTDTFNKRIAAAFAKGAAAYFLALRSSEEPSDGHRKTEGGLEEEKDPFEMIRWDTFLEQRAFELIETEGKCEEQKAFDAVAPRILPTVGVAAHVPTSDRARAVRQLWQEAPDYSVELHILSHSGDKMDMKQSLALVHFMLVGSDPSLPDVRLSPEEMARRLGFSTRVLHARLNAIVRMGREAYLQALSKSTSPFLSQP
jgi:DNA-binding NarL/FixJ family response regulator